MIEVEINRIIVKCIEPFIHEEKSESSLNLVEKILENLLKEFKMHNIKVAFHTVDEGLVLILFVSFTDRFDEVSLTYEIRPVGIYFKEA